LTLATLISAGFSPGEVGAVCGLTSDQVNTAMARLRQEIRDQRP
jgi:DNA-directed RNA polymerase specialized sigma24 family protein